MDMMKIFGKMKEVQAKLQEAQEGLADITETAEAGGGMVKVTINGKKQIVNLDIDDDLVKPEDKEMLQDLVVAAVNKAMESIEVRVKEELKKSTEGFMPNIPGMDFGM
ncbi:MAG: DNA-binding protein [Thalassobius sp.]|nr:DNA-binding protein [Thalassovita sp.]